MSPNKRLRMRRRPRSSPGTAPGSVVVDSAATTPTIDVCQYSNQKLRRWEGISCDDIPTPNKESVTWVNVCGLGDKSIIDAVTARFNIHDLAAEDVVNTYQRPKVDDYSDHLYIVMRMPTFNGELDLEQVSIFLGANYVLTWQEHEGDCFNAIRNRLASPKRLLRQHGCDFLAYAIIDAIVDSYFPVLGKYDDLLDSLEDQLVRDGSIGSLIGTLHQIRGDVRNLRRVAWSHQEVSRNLIEFESSLITEQTQFHLRDVRDHTIRVVELVEGSRESCSDLRDLHMSMVSMRMNEVMKVLTIIATIFIPLGFIAGLYGMNFSNDASPWNLPETQLYYGYPMALMLMGIVAACMLLYFRRRGWIGSYHGKGGGE